jgi:crotonobetainyl-CoA:carnitine CoA-transferase CaiB-like acyl-CoA transferase
VGLLDGVRVVEFSRLIAAPFCGLSLRDLGAEVIKVEPPQGDHTRGFPPFLAPGESAYFHTFNRGKRGIALDLADPRAPAVVRRLIDAADVVVENLGDASSALGVEFEEAASRNPRLVWCSITGFGRGRGGRAIDPSLQARTGIMALTGEVGGPPLRVPVPLVDFMTGMYATQSVLAALWRAEREGRGAFLDCAMMDAAATLGSATALLALGDFLMPRRIGSDSYIVAPSAVFETGDGDHVQLLTLSERHWEALCGALGHTEWLEDPLFADNDARLANRELLHQRIGAALAGETAEHWVETITQAGGFCERVREIEEAWSDPAMSERGLLGTLEGEGLDAFPIPVASLAHTGEALARGPRLGEHSGEVARELGYSPEELDELVGSGALPRVAHS